MIRFAMLAACVLASVSPAADLVADKQKAGYPLGTFEREEGADGKVAVMFNELGRFSMTFSGTKGNEPIRLQGQYDITRDAILFGIITNAEKTGDGPGEDETFCFRFRLDGPSIIIREIKGKGFDAADFKRFQGRFKDVRFIELDKAK